MPKDFNIFCPKCETNLGKKVILYCTHCGYRIPEKTVVHVAGKVAREGAFEEICPEYFFCTPAAHAMAKEKGHTFCGNCRKKL